MPKAKKLPLTAAERQSRYRKSRSLGSIDLSRSTLKKLEALRTQTGLSTDPLIAAALKSLAIDLDRAGHTRSKRRNATLAEQSVLNAAQPGAMPVVLNSEAFPENAASDEDGSKAGLSNPLVKATAPQRRVHERTSRQTFNSPDLFDKSPSKR